MSDITTEIHHIPAELDYFDKVDVSLVEIDSDGICTPVSKASDPDCQYMWSVYLHYTADNKVNVSLGRAGVECAADFPTKEFAHQYANCLRAALSVIREAEELV